MNAEIHPKYHPVCFQDVSSGRRFLTRSTMRSNQKEMIDGIEHFIVVCDITMDTHPAYTGKKGIVDTAGRVEKFQNKFGRRRRGK